LIYKHLTIEERYQIQAYKEAGYFQKEIAKKLQVSPATISRELKRNSSKIQKRYSAKKADKLSAGDLHTHIRFYHTGQRRAKYGAKYKGKIKDRASMFVKISIPTSKKAIDIETETLRLLEPFKDKIHTITSDNGFEFSNHKNISEALKISHHNIFR
jgi:IS30 family transposase